MVRCVGLRRRGGATDATAEAPGLCVGNLAANLKREKSHTNVTAPDIPPPPIFAQGGGWGGGVWNPKVQKFAKFTKNSPNQHFLLFNSVFSHHEIRVRGCVCQGNQFNRAQTARFNIPTLLPLLQTIRSVSGPAGGLPISSGSPYAQVRGCVCVCVCAC